MGGITQNYTKRERAAILIAEDDLADEAISAAVGITRKTLHNWKQDPDFTAIVGDRVGQIQAAMLKHAIAKKHRRLAVLDDLHDKALQVIEERIDTDGAPGQSTGLVVRQLKQIGAGKSAEVVEEFTVDTGLLREIRALHEQAAKELGQWTEKADVTIGGGMRREYVLVAEGD